MSNDTERPPETETRGGPLSDDQLIELFWQRDERAISATADKYGPMLFRIAYNILHDRQDCEECQNDALLGVWNAIPPTRPAVLRSFLAGIVRNIATKRYKQRMSLRRVPPDCTLPIEELEDLLRDGETPDQAFHSRELGRLVSEYVRTLSERQRYIFVGRFYMSETIEHLAEALGVGVGTVHRNIEKLRRGLKEYLERKGISV